MSFLSDAFNIILYQPLLNALIFLYQYLPGSDFGIAIIVLTILIRLVLYPSMAQSLRSQKSLSALQPKIQEIQEKYKEDKEKLTKEMLALYQREKINPFSSFLPLLVQLPILIALYQVFWRGFQATEMLKLYSFIPNPWPIDPTFLGLINLNQASMILAVIAGITQYFQSKMITPQTKKQEPSGQAAQFSGVLQKQMLYFFPIFTVFILWRLPSAIGLYWIVTSLFSIIQQKLILKEDHAKSN